MKYDPKIYQDILDELAVRKVFITYREGKLHCLGPRGALTPELKALIASNKEGLIRLINESFKEQAHEAIKPHLGSNYHSIPKAKRLDIRAFSNLEAYYASFSQSRIWFLDQMETNKTIYQMPYLWKLPSGLQIPALQSALTKLIERHEVLRTSFIFHQSDLLQLIHAPQAFDLKIRVLDHGHTQSDINNVLWSEISIPFDLSKPPLLRALLIGLQSDGYLLLLTVHHIASDGWSSSLLLQELSMLYKAVICEEPSNLPLLPTKYADFAAWQRERLSSGNRLHQLISYWEQQLQSVPNLDLPTDYLRLDSPSYQGNSYSFYLDSSLTFDLQTLCQQHGATLHMGLLALVATLLQRYSSQDQFAIGVPTWGRNHPDLESLIGCFINTLVIRVNFTGSLSFSSFLKQVSATSFAAYDHQELPFERLVEVLQIERDLSCNPLVQVMVQLIEMTDTPLKLDGLQAEPITVPFQPARLDLEFHFYRLKSGVQGTIVYSTDLFSAERIQRMEGHLQTLLKSVLQQPDAPLLSLSLLTYFEQKQLNSWSQGVDRAIHQLCVHQVFEKQVDRAPDAIALVFENEQLTYRELNLRANQLAHYLQKQGVGPEVLVGICVERSLEMIVGLLGILKAGGAYVPLDPTYPTERLAFMLEDAQVSVLLTQKHFLEKLPATPAQIVELEAFEESSDDVANLPSPVTASNLAYIMYTSGSTGQPKGVSILHRGIVRLVKNPTYVHLSSEEVFLQLAPISFDASTFEIWGSLLNGAQLAIFPPGIPSLEELGQAIRRERVTTLWLTAGLFHLMVDERLEDLKSLRQLLAGGDVLSVSHIRKFTQTVPGCQLINGYGPTENTTFTCCYPITNATELGNSVPIGRAITNTQVYILDEQMQPVPIGVPGELYTGGDGLARDYLNRPKLTAEKFIPNPFGAGRLYKTGDLARYRPDGNIEFIGRIDNQVKIRGFRIEFGEIEAVLTQHRDIQETLVITKEDPPTNKSIIAYIVANPHQVPTSKQLRQFLKQQLPEYMIPAAFVTLEALPFTPNGKIDRQALPASDSLRPDPEETFVAPGTPTEQQIADIWIQLLKLEQIGIHDNFFTLGGHSLLATQVISRLRQTFGIELPLQTLFEAPTVGELSDLIETICWASQQSQALVSDTTSDYEEGRL